MKSIFIALNNYILMNLNKPGFRLIVPMEQILSISIKLKMSIALLRDSSFQFLRLIQMEEVSCANLGQLLEDVPYGLSSPMKVPFAIINPLFIPILRNLDTHRFPLNQRDGNWLT